MIKCIAEDSRNTYGSRRIKQQLNKRGMIVSRRLVIKLMQAAHLTCKTKRRFKITTDSKHNNPIATNLLARQFSVTQPNRYWVGDITYIPTQEGWLYLATVIDLFSRKVVGWSMSPNMKADLVNKALLMAIWQRKPPKGLVWHTDRGSQYASDSHLKILKQHNIMQSMSRKGDCWDNAVAESFFHTLKTELTHHHKFKTREEAQHLIFEYIEVFYNRIRIHSSNQYCSPVEYELMQKYA
jgi:putative transposase